MNNLALGDGGRRATGRVMRFRFDFDQARLDYEGPVSLLSTSHQSLTIHREKGGFLGRA